MGWIEGVEEVDFTKVVDKGVLGEESGTFLELYS